MVTHVIRMKDLTIEKQTDPYSIGSFRNDLNFQKHLPQEVRDVFFGGISDGLDVQQLITLKNRNVNFNNGAFGHAYDEVSKLALMLQQYSEENPEVFYDQVCLPLVSHTYNVLEEFFGTENVLLVQNCTVGMRCIAETLIRDQCHTQFACLYPIYGATMKLLQYFESKGQIEPFATIAPGENPLFEEDSSVIVSCLEETYAMERFTVLFCDEVASQSGRILPLDAVAEFCEKRSIVLVVDGTQSCQLFFGNKKNVLNKVDYFVMSTHKWLGKYFINSFYE